ncbi:hypothetical protein [Nocardia albiluteola]|uniref:hypothetical protein n=1 Tax=Nocardia albiluteola TaxID=2842303 RepID=UPI001C07D3A3|nr:hypothetical protein [Nocardia albiluteola]
MFGNATGGTILGNRIASGRSRGARMLGDDSGDAGVGGAAGAASTEDALVCPVPRTTASGSMLATNIELDIHR